MFNPLAMGVSRGINQGVSEDSLQSGEVRDARNFLFRRGEAITRPGLLKQLIPNPQTNIDVVFNLFGPIIAFYDTQSLPGGTNKLFSLTSGSYEEITGHAVLYFIIAPIVFNAVVLNPGIGGLIRWDPLAGNLISTLVALPAGVTYSYLLSFAGHVIAANESSAAVDAAVTVAYSDEGDETNWTTGSAGRTVLTDINGSIQGLFTIRNVGVIAHSSGFHTITPTGTSLPPFRFDRWSIDGVGLTQALHVDDNIAYFIGQDNVYTFDLSNTCQPIGDAIKDLLIYLTQTLFYTFYGFMTWGEEDKPHRYYNLTNMNNPASINFFPGDSAIYHFMYDITERTWQIMHYEGMNVQGPIIEPNKKPQFVDKDGNFQVWDKDTKIETDAYIQGGDMFVPPLTKDFRIDRALVKFRDFGLTDQVSVTVEASGQDTTQRAVDEHRSIGSSRADERYLREWFRTSVVGNGFRTRIDVRAGTKFCLNYIELQAQEDAGFMGAMN